MTSATQKTNPFPEAADVGIVGGGPFGLMLANELGRRGVSVVLVDKASSTAFNPQANATQARTMEYFRRLGFVDVVRAGGLPEDFPTDIAYFTRYAKHELGRFSLPSAAEAVKSIHSMSGDWSAAELPHRISQKFVEQILREQATGLPEVSVNYGWRMMSFEDQGNGVLINTESVEDGTPRQIHVRYMVGGDGPHSPTRRALGFHYEGEAGTKRDFMGGRMLAVYLRAPAFYDVVPHPPAWMNVCFNPHRRAFMAAVDGKGEFAFHTQLKAEEAEGEVTEARARELFLETLGTSIPVEILSVGTWTAGFTLVAEHYQKGRVLIGGDAAHLFTPTGGLGYNTAVEDAVNLGWKLAAVLDGIADPALLDTYEIERRPIGVRNTNYARKFADSLGLFEPVDNIESEGTEAEQARKTAGEYLAAHGRAEFNIPGITFGTRYDGSPVIVGDGTNPPPDKPNEYTHTACPGGRPPHLWLDATRSLYDAFGLGWTLLCTDGPGEQAPLFVDGAAGHGLALNVVHEPRAHELYEASYALIRPDHVVAWRGDDVADAQALFSTLLGKHLQEA